MYIRNAIKNLIHKKPVLFTTPGHSLGCCVSSKLLKLLGRNIFKADFSEVEGMDNLQDPSGAILKSLEKTQGIYGTKKSFYLINGSSSGVIALMLATIRAGDKILIARNAHKSVINALILSGASPVWLETEWEENFNVSAQINPEKIRHKLNEIPDIKAVWITSPTYEGIISDIKTISKTCNEKNIPLIVDEAHGALLPFSTNLPESAIESGADACVQSLHKTANCLNQGAILHLSKNSKINPEKIQQSLNLINTTSPSYILLASIEASVEYLDSKKGREKFSELLENIDSFKNYLKNKLDISFLENTEKYLHDPTKVFLKLNTISGYDLSGFLMERFRIEEELNNAKGLLFLTGIGTTAKKLDYLSTALIKASKILPGSHLDEKLNPYIKPETIYTPYEVFNKNSKTIKIENSINLISKETIVNYPPGIPLVISGEKIQEAHLEFLGDRKTIEVVDD